MRVCFVLLFKVLDHKEYGINDLKYTSALQCAVEYNRCFMPTFVVSQISEGNKLGLSMTARIKVGNIGRLNS